MLCSRQDFHRSLKLVRHDAPARRAPTAGLTIPAADILIVACARHHGGGIESTDAHFAVLAKLQAGDG